MTGTELDRPAPVMPMPVMSSQEVDDYWRIASALAKSNFFKDARGAEQAFAKILFGRDLGLSPTEAMQAIHIIDGRAELSANLQASRVKASERYDYKVRDLTDERCLLQFYEGEESLGVSEFTMDNARTAGLTEKHNWQHYPRNMLFARAMSNGVAWYCPDVMGGVRVYSEGEVEERFGDVAGETGPDPSPASTADYVAEFAPSPETAGAIVAVLARASGLGHAGFSDLAAAEMAVRGQPVDVAWAWVNAARAELDAFEQRKRPGEPDEQIADAEVVPDDEVSAEAETGGRGEEGHSPGPPPAGQADPIAAGQLSGPMREALLALLRGERPPTSSPTMQALWRRGLVNDDGALTADGAGAARALDAETPRPEAVPADAGDFEPEPVQPEPAAETPDERAERAARLEERAQAKLDAADEAEGEGNADLAAELRAEADQLHDEAVAAGDPDQMELG